MLSQMLPYVPGLKSLDLTINYKFSIATSYTLFSDILNLSELEELSIDFESYTDFESPELFLKELPKHCPRIRILKFGK